MNAPICVYPTGNLFWRMDDQLLADLPDEELRLISIFEARLLDDVLIREAEYDDSYWWEKFETLLRRGADRGAAVSDFVAAEINGVLLEKRQKIAEDTARYNYLHQLCVQR